MLQKGYGIFVDSPRDCVDGLLHIIHFLFDFVDSS